MTKVVDTIEMGVVCEEGVQPLMFEPLPARPRCPWARRAAAFVIGFLFMMCLVLQLDVASMAKSRTTATQSVQVGPRPYYLVDSLPEGELKTRLLSCGSNTLTKSEWVMGHRGAPLMFPEHSLQSYHGAARMGAGIIECDVTFTKDNELVCRHSECDLHTTTNILLTDLASKCAVPFTPASGSSPATALCCTSALTVAEFKTLQAKMDGFNASATTAEDFQHGTPDYRTDLYATHANVVTHRESIAVFQSLGVKMVPELKAPHSGTMPPTFPREAFIQKLLSEYREAGIAASNVFVQSFLWSDILSLAKTEFGNQAVFLDSRTYDDPTFIPTLQNMTDKYAAGLRFIAPEVNALVGTKNKSLVETDYSILAKAGGLQIVSWSLERSASFFDNVRDVVTSDREYMMFIDFLAQQVKVVHLFCDWPGTILYYANCFGL
eukprot:TRINITY_DN28223_c0_g1_i1.p1 TRINITY_DN28223_c0_g1~~TRINITY_DN28223_c0_g1_i1.p1  ORF type:complete len:452 (+),score=141.86 TRINITY_DN28223_c0_g1_i1:49-1356(+)